MSEFDRPTIDYEVEIGVAMGYGPERSRWTRRQRANVVATIEWVRERIGRRFGSPPPARAGGGGVPGAE